MTRRDLTAAIIGHLILSVLGAIGITIAEASTVPERTEIGHGIYHFVSPDGYSSFGPPEGFDVIYGAGKGAGLREPWPEVKGYRATPDPHHTARTEPPALPLTPGLIDNPACRRPPYPWFCEMDEPPVDPPEPPAVPLPGSAWMLLAGLLSLFCIPRRKIARRRDDLVAKPGA